MAGTQARRRPVRALRVVAALGLAAVALGTGTPVRHATDSATQPRPVDLTNRALLDSAASFLAEVDVRGFRLVQPGGRGPLVVHLPAPAAPAAPAAPSSAPAPSATPSPKPTTPAPRPSSAVVPAGRATLPLGVDAGQSTEVITLVAASSRSTTAQLTAWQRGPGGWTAVVGPVTARIGSAGVGQASETSTRTPAGTFTLTQAFGRSGNPGTGLPYRRIDTQDWWVSDVASSLYNQHTRCAAGTCPFDEAAGENLWSEGSVYDLAVVIDYNRAGVRGAGSAFFLHITNGAPTAGCVAIDRTSLTRIMRWLTPGARPLIAIGVG